MTPENAPTKFDLASAPSTEEQLGRLCRAQQLRIATLSDQLARALQANRTLGGELLEASEARAEALCSLATQVKKARELAEVTVKQRDTVLTALRRLVAAYDQWETFPAEQRAEDVFSKILREATELLKVIDQLQSAAGARPPG